MPGRYTLCAHCNWEVHYYYVSVHYGTTAHEVLHLLGELGRSPETRVNCRAGIEPTLAIQKEYSC